MSQGESIVTAVIGNHPRMRCRHASRPVALMLLGLALVAPTRLWASDRAGYTVPETPAFTFLNASPTKITEPGSAQDLGVEILNAIGDDGKVKQGIAVSVQPARLLKLAVTLDDYQRLTGYAVYNAQVSFGTAKTPGDDGSTDLALGLRVPLLDRADRMRNAGYRQFLAAAMDGCAKPDQPGKVGNWKSCVAKQISDGEFAHWADDNWNASRVSVALAMGWRAHGSDIGDTDWMGVSTWLAGSFRVGPNGQVLAQVQYAHHPAAVSESGKAQDDFAYGSRASFGSDRAKGFLEVSGARSSKAAPGVNKTSGAWSGGGEVRISPDLWVVAGFGKAFATELGTNPVHLTANLRWAISSDPPLKIGPTAK